jgi:hypothetical protein
MEAISEFTAEGVLGLGQFATMISQSSSTGTFAYVIPLAATEVSVSNFAGGVLGFIVAFANFQSESSLTGQTSVVAPGQVTIVSVSSFSATDPQNLLAANATLISVSSFSAAAPGFTAIAAAVFTSPSVFGAGLAAQFVLFATMVSRSRMLAAYAVQISVEPPPTFEIAEQRLITHLFLLAYGRPVTLLPRVRISDGAGGYIYQLQSPRATQTMKLIEFNSQAGQGQPTPALTGIQRNIQYMLLGEWDAKIGIDDEFTLDNCSWVVKEHMPYNHWERRAIVNKVEAELVT